MRRVSTIKEIIASFLQLTFIKRKEEAASIAEDMALIAIIKSSSGDSDTDSPILIKVRIECNIKLIRRWL